MCSPAVRLRGTDRWPFWLALAVSRQHPILSVWMIVLGRAKTNSSSTWGPNKLTDLKPQGHAWRFRFHLSAVFCGKKERWDGEKTGGGLSKKHFAPPDSFLLFNLHVFVLNCFLTEAFLHGSIQKLPISHSCECRQGPRLPGCARPPTVGGALLLFLWFQQHKAVNKLVKSFENLKDSLFYISDGLLVNKIKTNKLQVCTDSHCFTTLELNIRKQIESEVKIL